jgi:hypothetical protein
MAFYYDTLFVACGYMADGDSVHLAAKFVGANYADTCSGPVGVIAIEDQDGPRVTFNAGHSEIVVLSSEAVEVRVVDALGQQLAQARGREPHIPTVGWSPGIYLVRIKGHQASKVLVH